MNLNLKGRYRAGNVLLLDNLKANARRNQRVEPPASLRGSGLSSAGLSGAGSCEVVGLEWGELGGPVCSQCALGSAPARLLRVIRAPLVAPGRPPLPGERPVHWAPCSSPPPPKPHLPAVGCAGMAAGKREHIPPVDGLGGGETPWFDITWESRSSWASSGLDIFKSLLSSPPLLSTAPR